MKGLVFALWALFSLGLISPSIAKSSYEDGNYSEAAGAQRMCMRCHMKNLNPSGVSISLTSSAATVLSGQSINVFTSNSGFGADWAPGAAVHFDYNSQFASRTPQEYGWVVGNDPKTGPYNFITDLAKNQQSVWQFVAPRKTGNYRLAISGYFNDSSLARSEPGTIRGSSSLQIQVLPAAETVKPSVQAVVGRYKNYVFIKFSEAVTEATAGNVANYSLVENVTSQIVTIEQAVVSRLGDVVTLKTVPLKAGTDYSLTIQGVVDYAASPNLMDPVSTQFTPNFTDPYKIYAEWSTDVTDSEIGEDDEDDHLGGGLANSINRLVHVFYIGDNLLDLLPDIDYSKAVLRILQSGTTPPASPTPVDWDLVQLVPDNQGWDFFGNNITQGGYDGPNISTQVLWSGGNPVSGSTATNTQAVGQVLNGSPEVWWEWDVSNSFASRYATPGGTGPNGAYYFTRIQAANENGLMRGPKFYGSDAADLAQRPYIELSIAPPDTVGISKVRENKMAPFGIKVYKNDSGLNIKVAFQNRESKPLWIRCYNEQGELLKSTNAGPLSLGTHDVTIPLDNFSRGIYFINLRVGTDEISKKVILF